ncbi:hypothetical protein [Paenibacillus sp. GCM10027626]|uniref:hypothetical protein n=1 Tax=Paenibacillus sp. GCM10027626 TaxID=3273411 RepID=UPI003626E8E9
MKSLNISSIRWISTLLIAFFMIFSTPTPLPETVINEAARTVESPTVESFVKPHVRTGTIISAQMRLTALAAIFSFLIALVYSSSARKLVPLVPMRPIIAIQLKRIKLTPVKFTSLFV